MKRIQYHAYGSSEVMRLEDFVVDEPGRGEVVIAVHCAAINPIDWKMRRGDMKIVTGQSFPRGMGMDLTGVITATGPGVTRFRVGDAVFGLARFKQTGALGEAAIAKETALAIKPEGLSFADAAPLGTAGVTAWNGLVDKAGLKAGQRVFVNGCGGSVGEAAVQIAHLFRAEVSGSCGAEAMERARSLGVRDVFDYRRIDLSTLTKRFDVVFDAAGTISTGVGVGMLRKGGVFTTVEPTPWRLVRSVFDRRVRPIVATPRSDLLDRLAGAARDGAFQVRVGEMVALDEAISLIADLERGKKVPGKAVVVMG